MALRREARRDTISKARMDSAKLAAAKKARMAPKFKSKQDTIRAAVVAKTKTINHLRVPIERPEHPYYTVQIGAFGKVANALRAQKTAKGRFHTHPIFNNFIKSANLYRVSIGRFENVKEATELQNSMEQEYPNEYQHCWINIFS
jgi:cell division septation protein DedD